MKRAHLVQIDSVWEDRSANLRKAGALIRDAGVTPGDFVCLPEMFDTGFSTHTAVTADRAGETRRWVQGVARELGCWVQAGTTVSAEGSACFNAALVATPTGEIAAEYHKTHLFPTEVGPLIAGHGAMVVDIGDTPGARVLAPIICYDLRFPELFGDSLRFGANLYCVSACWPKVRLHHWRALLIARAIENQAIVLGVTRCGHEPTTECAGGSIAVGPRGDVLGELQSDEGVLSVELPWDDVAGWRRAFPAWKSRRQAAGDYLPQPRYATQQPGP